MGLLATGTKFIFVKISICLPSTFLFRFFKSPEKDVDSQGKYQRHKREAVSWTRSDATPLRDSLTHYMDVSRNIQARNEAWSTGDVGRPARQVVGPLLPSTDGQALARRIV